MAHPLFHTQALGRPAAAPLNQRDLQVLEHLAEGRSTAGVAVALSVTGNTARTRIRRLQRKLDACDRAEAVRVARQLGVISGSGR
ncbi:response regulator transcription factor [Blastococcus sp. SYSU D01042]